MSVLFARDGEFRTMLIVVDCGLKSQASAPFTPSHAVWPCNTTVSPHHICVLATQPLTYQQERHKPPPVPTRRLCYVTRCSHEKKPTPRLMCAYRAIQRQTRLA